MENDGPVAAVQIRLAKGEITTVQYREIMTHLLKNISSFQQTSSLKILQVRYAKGEVNADQYHEIFSSLMKNLSTQSWAPPLQILHERYAEGQISTSQYQEMISHLTQEQFTYDQSTPLWILNNRYARGELTTTEYEEILSLFTDFTLALMQGTTKTTEKEVISVSMEKPDDDSLISEIQSPAKHSELPGSKIPVPDLQSSPSPESINQKPQIDDKITTTIKISETRKDDITTEHPSQKSESKADEEQEDIINQEKKSNISVILEESSKKKDKPGITNEESQNIEKVRESNKLREIPLISIGDKTTKIQDSPSGFPTDKTSQGVKEATFHFEKKQESVLPSGFHHFPTADPSSMTQSHEPEALPTNFFFQGGKPDHRDTEDMEAIPANPENLVNYLIPPGSISGGEGNTYQTATSQISLTETSPISISSESKKPPHPKKEYTISDLADIRQKVKTYIVKGEYTDAIALADSGIELSNDDFLLYFYKGMAKYYLHDHENALKDLHYALGICKNNDEIKKIETIIHHITAKLNENPDNSSDIR